MARKLSLPGSRSGIPKPERMIRIYHTSYEFKKDARRLAEDGWKIANLTGGRRTSGGVKVLFSRLRRFIRRPKPGLVATYSRAANPEGSK